MTMNGKLATMLYDGDCGFCAHMIKKWQKITGETIRYRPYQDALADFPQVSAEICCEAVQLIMPDGSVVSGAHAVFKAMDLAGTFRILHWSYDRLPIFGRISELIYQLVAHHRLLISKLFLRSVKKCEYRL